MTMPPAPFTLAGISPMGIFAFLSPSYGEMLVVVVVALLLFGSDLPNVARSWGKTFSEFRRGLTGIQNELNDVIYSEPERLEYRHDASSHYDSLDDHSSGTAPLIDATEAGIDLEGQGDSTAETSESEVDDHVSYETETAPSESDNSESSDPKVSDNETSDSELSNLIAPDSEKSPAPQERTNTHE